MRNKKQKSVLENMMLESREDWTEEIVVIGEEW